MSRKVRISLPAQRDLDEIWFFIAQDSLDAADRFVDHLTDKFSLLAFSPRLGRSREDLGHELRSFPVKILPGALSPLEEPCRNCSCRPHRSWPEGSLEV